MPALSHKKTAPKDGCELSYLFNIYKHKPCCLLIRFTNLVFLLIQRCSCANPESVGLSLQPVLRQPLAYRHVVELEECVCYADRYQY